MPVHNSSRDVQVVKWVRIGVAKLQPEMSVLFVCVCWEYIHVHACVSVYEFVCACK